MTVPMNSQHDPLSGTDPGQRARSGPRLALLLALAGLIGGVAGAGLLSVTGAVDTGGGGTTTVVERTISTGTGASGASAETGKAALDVNTLYESASPGVVDITATAAASGPGPIGPAESTSTGTGFVIDARGRILTASHVVSDATRITVEFQDGTRRTATLLSTDDATDVAVIRVDPAGLTLDPLKLGTTASLSIGDPVAAIGDPFGYDRSITTGIVSGLDRTIEAPNGFTVAHAVQTDAALNPGNSGGPLLAADGTVIGIVDQIATNGNANQSSGVGFAVPIDLVAGELGELIAGKQVSHAYIGIATSDASGTTSGALVSDVASGGPAAAAGLAAGDVVTDIGGTAVTGSSDLVATIAEHAPGDTVNVTVRRGSRSLTFSVVLGTQPATRTGGG